ncbi:hypothetical protein DOY81_009204 [Sarcophaga bullata]|nr:hypothetical protein DOY81_009204 [Sarcophaga bullata]
MPKPKFPMHDMHFYKSLRIVYTACTLTVLSGVMYYYMQYAPLRAAYVDFYTTYDPVASFNRMMKAGYISAVPAPSKGDDKPKDQKK